MSTFGVLCQLWGVVSTSGVLRQLLVLCQLLGRHPGRVREEVDARHVRVPLLRGGEEWIRCRLAVDKVSVSGG